MQGFPKVWSGSPAFQSGKVINPDGTVTLREAEFWTVTSTGDKEALPNDAHIVSCVADVKGGTVTATAHLRVAGVEAEYKKTVPLERVRWVTSDGRAYSDLDVASAREDNLNGK